MFDAKGIAKAIREENLDGWLFYNYKHKDPVADALLGVNPKSVNSRPWVCLVRADESVIKLVHAIEPSMLDQAGGSSTLYDSREGFIRALRNLPKGRYGADFSTRVPAISFLDAGALGTLSEAGVQICEASGLIQRRFGVLDAEGTASHQRAAQALYRVILEAWAFIEKRFSEGPLHEHEVVAKILSLFSLAGLETDHDPIVGFGRNTADPHYEVRGKGARLEPGDTVQLDIWAKERKEGAVYADISWLGVAAPSPGPAQAKLFAAVSGARDAAVAFIRGELAASRRPSGSSVDALVRGYLCDRGYASYIKHRTGHGIDVEVHGSGVNLDSVEFPDDRLLLDGSLFSVEPGLYLEDMGGRTEIDVLVRGDGAEITGGLPQTTLLTLGGEAR